MLVKYVTREYYAIGENFDLHKVLKSLNKEYPSDEFAVESIIESEYGDEMIIKISQTVPFSQEPVHCGFEYDNGQIYG